LNTGEIRAEKKKDVQSRKRWRRRERPLLLGEEKWRPETVKKPKPTHILARKS